jgi:diguanylate cyclase (GGDEF)-like protein
LKRLSLAAHNLIEGDMHPVSLDSGGPEIRELGHAFNLMISWLADYRNEVNSYQAMLERQAFYDELTGLANRTLLKEHLQQALSQSRRRNTSIALLFLDLDRFKYVNDTLGHSFGDHLLQGVSLRLRQLVRATDTVARMGGDEFVMILNDLNAGPIQARHESGLVAEQIAIALSQPFNIQGHDIGTSFSIGIALCPHDGKDNEVLIRNADCAMYDAKTHGRNTYRFYEPALQQYGARRLTLENGLKRALELGELHLYFQPKYDSIRRTLIGAEALLRWRFGHEWISPVEFIPLAEETNQMLAIGDWVLQNALTTVADWRLRGVVSDEFQISVNVSPSQFWHPEFAVSTLKSIHGLVPNASGVLELELTESCLLRPSDDIKKTFNTLRMAGLRFAIDDFGTGYSSLSYLKQFPLDVLKIDQSFVRDCIDDPGDATIIRAIIAMAKGLGLDVIAEGVETMEHAAFLSREGCNLLQGYLLAKPMPADEFEDFCQNLPQHPLHGGNVDFDKPLPSASPGQSIGN